MSAAGRRRLPRSAVLTVVALLAMLLCTAAGAQAAPGAAEPVALELVSQTPLVPADGELELRFALGELTPAPPAPTDDDAADGSASGPEGTDDSAAGEQPGDDPVAGGTDGDEAQGSIRVIVTVYGRLLDPAELDAEPAVAINRRPEVALTSLPIEQGVATVRLPIRPGDQFDDVDRMLIPDAGVYPVTVELREGDNTVASLRTEMIRLPVPETPGAGAAPVGPPVATVLPVGADGLSVTAATRLLDRHPGIPVAPMLDGTALAILEADPELAAGLAAALGERTVILSTRPALDVSSLAAIGRLDRYRQAFAATRASATALGLPFDGATTTIDARQTAAGATELASLGVQRALHRGAVDPAVAPPSSRVRTDRGEVVELWARPIGTDLGGASRGPVERSQRVLAQLALADPDVPVLVNLDSGAEPDPDTLDVLLGAMVAPELRIRPLAELAPLVAREVAEPAERPALDLRAVTDHTATAVALLADYGDFHVSGPGEPEAYEAELDATLALTNAGDGADRTERVVALNRRLEAELATIALPENQSVTLAAQSAVIPLTIENNSSGARQVLLSFRSDKIIVEQNRQPITIEPGTASIDIDIQTRSLGVSPLQVSLLTPDGQRVLATTRFEVRSTAVPGLGLLISAVGLLLLGGWWYVSIRRRRSPPAEPGPGRTPPDEPAPSTPDRTDVVATGSV